MPALDAATALGYWSFSPAVSAATGALAVAYLFGVVKVRRRERGGRWPVWRTACFLAGLAVVAVATQSAIGSYDDVLFWMHMVEHLLLIMVAPPLLVLGRPVILALHASRGRWHRRIKAVVRSRAVTALTCPPVALAIYAGAIVGTHLTSFMNLVVLHPLLDDAEHVLYLVAGYLFFLPLLGSEPIRWRMSYPGRFLLLALAMPVDTFVGVVFTQANHELFPAYLRHRPAWADNPVADLHAGGAVMWIGGDAIMMALIVGVFIAFISDARERGSAGPWLESVRRQALADHATRAGVVVPVSRARGTVDDNEESLASYNAYLAALARARPPRG